MNITQSIKLINSYFNKKYTLDIEIVETQNKPFGDGYIYFDESIKSRTIYIGSHGIIGKDLNNSETTLLTKECSHEKNHIFQKFGIFRETGTLLDVECAKEVLLYRGNRGLYLYNYESSLHEIEAEGAVLKYLPEMMSDLFPDIDSIGEIENHFKNSLNDNSLVTFINYIPSDRYTDILNKFNNLLTPENFPKKNFELSEINRISIYNFGQKDVMCRFIDSTGRVDEFEKYINSLSPIEQNTALLATNLLATQPDMVTLDKYKDFQEMYKNYTVIDSKERYNIEKQKDFLKDLLNLEPDYNFSLRR